jgi:hypothetical protein
MRTDGQPDGRTYLSNITSVTFLFIFLAIFRNIRLKKDTQVKRNEAEQREFTVTYVFLKPHKYQRVCTDRQTAKAKTTLKSL